MNIALIGSKFPPIIGGGETILLNLAKELGRNGHEVVVITSALENKEINYDNHQYFKIKTIEGFERFCSDGVNFKNVCEDLYSVLIQGNYDIVHVHNMLPMFLVSQFAQKIPAKIVFTFHNTPDPPKRIIGYFKNYELDRVFAENVIRSDSYSLLLAASKFYYKWALKLGANPKKIHLSYFGIDDNKFDPKFFSNKAKLRNKYGINQKDFVITFPSRVIERKGILEMINSLPHLSKQSFYPTLFIPALNQPFDLEFAKKVFREIDRLDLGHQIFIPKNKVTYDKMPEIYALSDLVVMPSYYEGLGLAVLEAMSMGVPVISTKVSGINEVIQDNVNGVLVKPKSALDLAAAIMDLKKDTTLMDDLVENGIRFVKSNFSSRKRIKEIEELYKSVLES